jgi:hypothetical protein
MFIPCPSLGVGIGHGLGDRYRLGKDSIRLVPASLASQHHALYPQPERQGALVILLLEAAEPSINELMRKIHFTCSQIRLGQDRRRERVGLLSTELLEERLKAGQGYLGMSIRQVSLCQQPLCRAYRRYIADLLCHRYGLFHAPHRLLCFSLDGAEVREMEKRMAEVAG